MERKLFPTDAETIADVQRQDIGRLDRRPDCSFSARFIAHPPRDGLY